MFEIVNISSSYDNITYEQYDEITLRIGKDLSYDLLHTDMADELKNNLLIKLSKELFEQLQKYKVSC